MQSILSMKKNWQHFELGMAVAELNFFKGNHIQDNSSISKSLEILTAVVAWHPETLMLMATLMLQLPVEKCNEAILLITLILTESELDFLGVQESKGLNLEVHILEVVSTTLVHATTIELSFDQKFTSQCLECTVVAIEIAYIDINTASSYLPSFYYLIYGN